MKILVLGGTEFMGRFLVETFLKDGHKITLINRGNKYWMSANPFGEAVNRIICDRDDTDEFKEVLRKSGSWDLVVDFSAFTAEDMETAVEPLVGKVGLYVYISSDSVYMVCKKKGNPSYQENAKIETEAVRPTDIDYAKKLNSKDSYGDGKLQCEEVLTEYFEKHKFPCVSLRLPDVFGPYDTSDRFWRYMLWIQLSRKGYPVYLNDSCLQNKLSFVYRDDVISAIQAIIKHPNRNDIIGQAFNVAQQETPTLKEFLNEIASAASIKPEYFVTTSDSSDSSDSEDSQHHLKNEYYPSVDFGAINISKVVTTFGWKPTSMQQSVFETVNWFKEAWHKFPSHRPLDDFSEDAAEILGSLYAK